MQKQGALPDVWLDRIWSIMRATYGAEFDRQWECPAGADPVAHVESLRQRWSEVLAGRSASSLNYALCNLPDRPPNLQQFSKLCNGGPLPEYRALPSPKQRFVSDPEKVAAAKQKLREIANRLRTA